MKQVCVFLLSVKFYVSVKENILSYSIVLFQTARDTSRFFRINFVSEMPKRSLESKVRHRGESKRRKGETAIRRNNPELSVLDALDSAIELVKDAGKYDANGSLQSFRITLENIVGQYESNVVTVEEASEFARRYAAYYFTLGGGGNGVIPPNSSLYFEGKKVVLFVK